MINEIIHEASTTTPIVPLDVMMGAVTLYKTASELCPSDEIAMSYARDELYFHDGIQQFRKEYMM